VGCVEGSTGGLCVFAVPFALAVVNRGGEELTMQLQRLLLVKELLQEHRTNLGTEAEPQQIVAQRLLS